MSRAFIRIFLWNFPVRQWLDVGGAIDLKPPSCRIEIVNEVTQAVDVSIHGWPIGPVPIAVGIYCLVFLSIL